MARSITHNVFAGSSPRKADHLVERNNATRAVDCKLWHGTLESWREPRFIRNVAASTKSVYYAHNCCWLESTQCASWAEGDPEQRHIFATQYNNFAYPVRLVTDQDCTPTVYRLGLPCPPLRPTAMAGATLSKAAAPRRYAYQYEDSFGGRSALSEPSEPVIVEDGKPVQVSGWDIPAGGWDIKKLRLFRMVAGFDSPIKDTENKIEAAWMLVAELPPGTASYVDTKMDFDLGESCGEDIVLPPPDGLRGMTWVKAMNCLAGFVGRRVYFTENNNYHNWRHSILLDDTVRAICESNGFLYVATDGSPYAIRAEAPAEKASYRPVVRYDTEALPFVGRDMVATPSGAAYATHNGLVMLSRESVPGIISAKHYAPDDWQKMRPDTSTLAYHEGRVFAFFERDAFCMAVRMGADTSTELDAHTELSARPQEVFVTRTGRLYFRQDGKVYEWNMGTKLMPHLYESGEIFSGVPINFAALQVRMQLGDERIELFSDGDLAVDETLNQSDTLPIPLWATGLEFRWRLTGTATVKSVTIAPSFTEVGP